MIVEIRRPGHSVNRQADGIEWSWLGKFHSDLIYDKNKWGLEAKNGFAYRTAIHKIRCPSCLAKIFPEDIRHKMNKRDKWVNACVNCKKDWSVANAD